MPWDWTQSTLYPHVAAEEAQKAVADLPSQPQQGLRSNLSVNTPCVSTQNQAIYGGYTTSSDYPPVPQRYPNNAGPGFLSSHQLDQMNAQRDPASNVASPQLSGNVYSHSSYSSANNLGSSDMSITNPWPITPFQVLQHDFRQGSSSDNYAQVPRDDAGLFSGGASWSLPPTDHGIPQHDIQSSAAVSRSGNVSSTNYEYSSASPAHPTPESPEDDINLHKDAILTIHEHPVNHSESRADSRMVCQCDDDNGRCGRTIIVQKDKITAHLTLYHFRSSVRGDTLVQCGWRGCRKMSRRDTIIRHIREVHFGLKRAAQV